MQILNPVFLAVLLCYTHGRIQGRDGRRAASACSVECFFSAWQYSERGFDTRPLVALRLCHDRRGELALAVSNLTMSMSELFMTTHDFPGASGCVLIFPHLSAAALQFDPRDKMGYVASLFSISRPYGGSIGNHSVLTTDLLFGSSRFSKAIWSTSSSVLRCRGALSHAPVPMPGRARVFNDMGSM